MRMSRTTAPNPSVPDPGDPLAPWNVDEAAYPHSGPTWEKLSFCVNYAVLAPSGHNTQPWRFKLGLDNVKLYADRTRALPMVDPHDRELVISCGAALFHLRLATAVNRASRETFELVVNFFLTFFTMFYSTWSTTRLLA